MDINDTLTFLRDIWFFAILGDDELAQLTRSAELKYVKAGERVFNQADPGDSFFIVYSGKIRILRINERQKEVNLGIRTRGDHFGETALISEAPRNATARAVEDTVLISIDKTSFHQYIFAKPEIREHFDKFIRFASIHRFLRSCHNLTSLSPRDLQEWVRNINTELFKEGDAVFRQGTEPDKFYLIERGKLKVVRWENNRPEIINFLREGDFFGEKALVEDAKRYADVICLTDCHLFSLSKDAFHELVTKSPRMKKVMEDRLRSYLTDKPPIPYQEMIKQELAASKRIQVEEDVSKADLISARARKKRFRKSPSFYYQAIRFPFIRQYDQMTCGTTCIMMIAKYYGKHFSSSRLRDLAHVDLSGSSLANLAAAAEQLGFSTRGMKLDFDKLATVQKPCIVHWQGFHYIVVYKVDRKHVWVADPALGLRKYTREYFCNNWNGITLILGPTPEFEIQTEARSSFKNFIQFVLPYRVILSEIVAASVFLSLFGLATPIFTQQVIDNVLSHNNISMLNIMFAGMILVLIFRIVVSIVRQYLIVHTSMKIDLRMLVAFYKHMLALPLGYFKVRKLGDFITRFGENIKIRDFLTNTALTLVLDTLMIIVYLSLMFYYNLQMAGLVLLFIPVFVFLTLVFTPLLKKLNIDSFTAQAESQSHLIESIAGIDTVKAMNVEYPTRWKWEDKFIKSLNVDFKLVNTAMYFHALGDFVGIMSVTIMLWYGANKVMQGALSLGELMAFMVLLGSIITPINRVIASWDTIQQTLVSVDRLNDVFNARPEFPQSLEETTGLMMKKTAGEIAFHNVFFRYGGDDAPYILSNINLTIAAGQTVAIVGRSGSGKTTLINLIGRFYDVNEGNITIDGCDIRNIDLPHLRRLMGFVFHESFVFNGTIRENIAMGDSDESIEKVIQSAKMANAHDFISSLAKGYETKVGESRLQLSGGQKQRIAIARVLYRNPEIIIFDEATSSLDSESEQAIQKNLSTPLTDKTSIIVAHRLSAVRNADHIIVLDNGEIVEQGTHEQLIEMHGIYHYFNHQQLNV